MSCKSGVPLPPRPTRKFRGQRALHVAVRTLHVASAGLVLGAATFGVDGGRWPLVAGVSGALLVADELYRYGTDWLRFVQAWVIVGKLALLWWGVLHPEHLAEAVWGAVIVGGVISHAPGALRQHAFWGEPGPCATKGERRVYVYER